MELLIGILIALFIFSTFPRISFGVIFGALAGFWWGVAFFVILCFLWKYEEANE